MAANNILPFAQGVGATVLSQAAYLAIADRLNGNQPGLANQQLVNKALLQLSAVAVGVAQFLADHQATDVGDALTAANLSTMMTAAIAAVVTGSARVKGLVGAPNVATPLTKYDLQALAVTLQSAAGLIVTQGNTANLTCDFGLAGPAANGRDVAAVFGINSWIYLYFIWNPTTSTLATLASTTAPSAFTGATLPAGYTHWAFATTVRWNGSSNIIPSRTQGSCVWYQLDYGGVNRVLAAGVSTVFAAVSLASFVPPNALLAHLEGLLSGSNSAVASFQMYLRPTGSGMPTGINAVDLVTQVASASFETVTRLSMPLGTTNQIDYRLSSAPTTGGGVIDVRGYTIPNGDS